MEVFEAYPGIYRYKHLPGFVQFILDHHLSQFAREQVELSFNLHVPMLATLSQRFSKEQLIEIAQKSTAEYFSNLKDNRAYDQIRDSIERWVNDQIPILNKFQITGRDITLVSYIRQQTFQKFIPLYTSNVQQALELSSEIDALMLGTNTTAIDTYVNILKGRVTEESLFSSKLIVASPAITFLFDIVDNKEIFVSGKVSEVMGYTSQEFLSKGENALLQLTHPEDIAVIAQCLEDLVIRNDDAVNKAEYRFLHKKGNYVWLRTYYVVFKRDELGRPMELMGQTFEVTAEKLTALALQKREQQLLEAQALAHIGSYEWNIQDGVSLNSPEVYRIFELEDDRHYEEFLTHVHPDDKEKVQEALSKAFFSGNYDCEYRYIKDGKEKVIWSLGKVEFEHSQPVRMIGTVQDITEIKKMEKDLLEKTKQLEQSNRSLQQFASVASHDLKEPLRKMSVFADMVMEAENDTISKASFDRLLRMQHAARSMMQMIQDILAFSMLEEKQQKQTVDLNIMMEEIMDLLDERIKEKGAKIIYHQLPEVYVIPSQFRQMLQNLISNALKFSKQDVMPQIEIKAKWLPSAGGLKPAAEYLQLSVCDNGIGIDNEYLETIFDLFKRLHPKTRYEGSGLGLAITRRIVNNHDGSISATSKPGEGTCFYITIPQ